jgi:hypothetical protein
VDTKTVIQCPQPVRLDRSGARVLSMKSVRQKRWDCEFNPQARIRRSPSGDLRNQNWSGYWAGRPESADFLRSTANSRAAGGTPNGA